MNAGHLAGAGRKWHLLPERIWVHVSQITWLHNNGYDFFSKDLQENKSDWQGIY